MKQEDMDTISAIVNKEMVVADLETLQKFIDKRIDRINWLLNHDHTPKELSGETICTTCGLILSKEVPKSNLQKEGQK
jgi:hypothetical protein